MSVPDGRLVSTGQQASSAGIFISSCFAVWLVVSLHSMAY
jgi:hypothetical protein